MLLTAAKEEDVEGCKEWSSKLGYLTGDESEVSSTFHCIILPTIILFASFLCLQTFSIVPDLPMTRHPDRTITHTDMAQSDDAFCSYKIHDPPRYAFPSIHASTVRVRSGDEVVGDHEGDQGADSGDVEGEADSTAKRDIFAK